MKFAKLVLLIPIIVYLFLAIAWYVIGMNIITGDEPHYLIIAESLIRDGDLKVLNNYTPGSPVLQEQPLLTGEGHAINGYSFHGIGLPLILAPAYFLGGVLGAKVAMAIIIGLIPFAIYSFSNPILKDEKWALVMAVLIGLGLPFITASNQIYPDLVAGLIIFYLLTYWLQVIKLHTIYPNTVQVLFISLLMGVLPWLHSKYILPLAILFLIYVYLFVKLISSEKPNKYTLSLNGRKNALFQKLVRLRFILIIGTVVLISAIILSWFNYIIFHSILGPWGSNAVSTNLQNIIMIFLGLHLDRMQGLFIQAPIFLLGVFGLAIFFSEELLFAFITTLIYFSILIPSSLHPGGGWYGGWSFSGRFTWSVILLWCFPLVFAIRYMREWFHSVPEAGSAFSLRYYRERELHIHFSPETVTSLKKGLGRAIIAALFLIPTIFVLRVIITDGYLYNRTTTGLASWVDGNAYSDFLRFTPVQIARFIPWFGDFHSYFISPINLIFCGLILVIALGGYFFYKRMYVSFTVVFCVFALATLGLLAVKQPTIQPVLFNGMSLPGNVGKIEGLSRVARKRDVGFVSFGPYLQLVPGTYEITLEYKADGPNLRGLKWDCSAYIGHESQIFNEGNLPFSQINHGKFTTTCVLPIHSNFEFRVFTGGGTNIRIRRLSIKPID